jgi:regulator of sigma E protease
LGLHLRIGPITAIKNHSPAAEAGFQVGDQILSVNGEPIGDPMRLPDQVRRLVGQSVAIEVQRGEQRTTLHVTPREPDSVQLDFGPQRPVGIESLGVAFMIQNTVAEVVPSSPSEKAGILPGDIVQAVEFIAANDADKKDDLERFGRPRPIELGENNLNWPMVHDQIQLSLPTTIVKLSYQRGDKLRVAEMRTLVADDWFLADRGIPLMFLEEINQASTWPVALKLGYRETLDSMGRVYQFLHRLLTGRLSPKLLSGPASIAQMAGREASESTARLLVFLTLLSANLAVVNFLPIPVLDGGHALFLIYEGIFRRPVNERVAIGLTMLGLCFILGLMLFVIGLDVWRLSGLAG